MSKHTQEDRTMNLLEALDKKSKAREAEELKKKRAKAVKGKK